MTTADFLSIKKINSHNKEARSKCPLLCEPWPRVPTLPWPAHSRSLLSNSSRASKTLPSAQVSLSSCKNRAPPPRDRSHIYFFLEWDSSGCVFLYVKCFGSALDWNSSSALLSPTWLKPQLRFNMWFWFIKTNFPQWAKQNTYNGPSGQIISEKACKTNSTAHSETQHMNNKRPF